MSFLRKLIAIAKHIAHTSQVFQGNFVRNLFNNREEETNIQGLYFTNKLADELKAEDNIVFQRTCLAIKQTTDLIRDDHIKAVANRNHQRQVVDDVTRECVKTNAVSGARPGDEDYASALNGKTPISNNEPDIPAYGRIDPQSDYGKRIAQFTKVKPLPSNLQTNDGKTGKHVTIFSPLADARMAFNAATAKDRNKDHEPDILTRNFDAFTARHGQARAGVDGEDSLAHTHNNVLNQSKHEAEIRDGSLIAPGKPTLPEDPQDRSFLIPRVVDFPPEDAHVLTLDSTGTPETTMLHVRQLVNTIMAARDEESIPIYIPKIESALDARYWAKVIKTAEQQVEAVTQDFESPYKAGKVRSVVIAETPNALLQMDAIMYELRDTFCGASLGWHDIIAWIARNNECDPQFELAPKKNPFIVQEYMELYHRALTEIQDKGGFALGGMYGILPIKAQDYQNPEILKTELDNVNAKLEDDQPKVEDVKTLQKLSRVATTKGLIGDILIQLKRGLDGYWIAHPDFMRQSMALTNAWEEANASVKNGKIAHEMDDKNLQALIKSMLKGWGAEAVSDDDPISGLIEKDIEDIDAKLRKELIDLEEMNAHKQEQMRVVANLRDIWVPDDVKDKDIDKDTLDKLIHENILKNSLDFNVEQAVQYVIEFLSGTGCVALPTRIDYHGYQVPVRVMDDKATFERSKFEVLLHVIHGRVSEDEFMESLDQSITKVLEGKGRVKITDQNSKWVAVAKKALIDMMTPSKDNPERIGHENALEYFYPYLTTAVQKAEDPIAMANTYRHGVVS